MKKQLTEAEEHQIRVLHDLGYSADYIAKSVGLTRKEVNEYLDKQSKETT